MNEPSGRMLTLLRAMLEGVRHDERLDYNDVEALGTAIAELEQRAEKAEAERDILLQQPDNRLDGYRELGAKCAALEERNDALKVECKKWKRVAVAQERAHQLRYSSNAEGLLAHGEMRAAIADLGDEWTEAIR